MPDAMDDIRSAILSDDLTSMAKIAVPDSYEGMVVLADEADMFAGMESREKDPRKSLHRNEVPTPELGPGEAIVAVMASAINYNTVWTSIFEPVSTFSFLKRYGKSSTNSPRSTTSPITWSARTCPASCFASGPESRSGRQATRSSPTACLSSSRIRKATTTR